MGKKQLQLRDEVWCILWMAPYYYVTPRKTRIVEMSLNTDIIDKEEVNVVVEPIKLNKDPSNRSTRWRMPECRCYKEKSNAVKACEKLNEEVEKCSS